MRSLHTHAIASAAIAISISLPALSLAQSAVPRPAPPVKMMSTIGKQVKAADFKGDVVLIQFLDTGCGHCQATARAFTKLQEDLGPRGLRVMGVAFNSEAQEKPDLVKEFVEKQHVGFPVGLAPRDQVLSNLGFSFMKSFGVPVIMVIDRKGIVRAQSLPDGSAELQDPVLLRPLLDRLLKEPK